MALFDAFETKKQAMKAAKKLRKATDTIKGSVKVKKLKRTLKGANDETLRWGVFRRRKWNK